MSSRSGHVRPLSPCRQLWSYPPTGLCWVPHSCVLTGQAGEVRDTGRYRRGRVTSERVRVRDLRSRTHSCLMSLPSYSHLIAMAPGRARVLVGCHHPFLASMESFWIQKGEGDRVGIISVVCMLSSEQPLRASWSWGWDSVGFYTQISSSLILGGSLC